MVQKANLVIIGISVGLAVGILVASLVFFAICWCKKRAHLRSVATLPIQTNGLGTIIESIASLPNSVTVKESEYLAKKPRYSWWNNLRKDQFVSTSGIPRYSYKYVTQFCINICSLYSNICLSSTHIFQRRSEGDTELHNYSGTRFIWPSV